MSLASALGFGSRKVRYAAVGLGDIAQRAMLPGIAHTGNSELTALVTADPVKAGAIGERYGVARHYPYERFDEMLASGEVDAIYLATPNWRHAEFAVPALEAGIHVLCEKPLEVDADQCRAILAAERASTAKLMVAYRLHFEPATLDAIARIRAGEIGEPRAFVSVFGQTLDPANHRAKHGALAGPLLDMGPYPINAARYLFGADPIEVIAATATRHPDAGLGDLDDTVSATLRFPGDRIAQFTVSYAMHSVGSLTVAGTKGSIALDPAFTFGENLEQFRITGSGKKREAFRATDQFGGQMRYFSDCILRDRDPEPDIGEGLADVLVTDGILAAIAGGGPVPLDIPPRAGRIDPKKQVEKLSPVDAPPTVNSAPPVRAG